jgi:hypothetical protein
MLTWLAEQVGEEAAEDLEKLAFIGKLLGLGKKKALSTGTRTVGRGADIGAQAGRTTRPPSTQSRGGGVGALRQDFTKAVGSAGGGKGKKNIGALRSSGLVSG